MSTTAKIGDDFLKIPKLSADGRNWVIYRERLTLSVAARGLCGHLTGTKKKPTEPQDKTEADGTVVVADQKDVDAYSDALATWTLNEAIVLQQIASTISDSLYLKIKRKGTVCEAWKSLKKDFESRSKMFVIDLRRRLQEQRCDDNGNVRAHFDTMATMREDLAALREDISEEDFATILIGSLPKTYDTYLSAILATMNVLGRALDPDALIQCVGDEFDRRTIANGTGKGKSQDVALYAGDKGGKSKKGKRSDLECFNCHKKGHKQADCWAKGGGKEGQGPKSQRHWVQSSILFLIVS